MRKKLAIFSVVAVSFAVSAIIANRGGRSGLSAISTAYLSPASNIQPLTTVPTTTAERESKTIPVYKKIELAPERVQQVTSLLKSFSKLERKALRNRQQQRELEDQIGSQKNLDQVYLLLSSRQSLESTSLESSMNLRMQAVDYLAQAAQWERNPIREDVIASVRNLLITDGLETLASDDARKVVIGDQVELFKILKSADPVAAKELTRASQGTRLAKIITIANSL